MSNYRLNGHLLTTAALLALSLMTLGAAHALAQSMDDNLIDLQFEIVNATTGQPGTIERLLLQYSSIRLETVIDIRPTGSLVDVPDAPVKERGKYILTVWSQDVPYHWSLRGRNFHDKPLKLYVFDVKSGLEDVTVVGLDLLVRKTESLLELEYLLQIENSARPQVTIFDEPWVHLALPEGVRTATLVFGNGPEPEEMEISNFPGGAAAFKVPLTTGRNPMRLKTTVEWSEGMNIPIGANIPIQSWSLVASPVNLDIQAFDLTATDISGEHGHLRYKGPQVAADDIFRFRMATLSGDSSEEELFTQPTREDDQDSHESTKESKDDDGGFPFVLLTPILVIVIALVARRRRQS